MILAFLAYFTTAKATFSRPNYAETNNYYLLLSNRCGSLLCLIIPVKRNDFIPFSCIFLTQTKTAAKIPAVFIFSY